MATDKHNIFLSLFLTLQAITSHSSDQYNFYQPEEFCVTVYGISSINEYGTEAIKIIIDCTNKIFCLFVEARKCYGNVLFLLILHYVWFSSNRNSIQINTQYQYIHCAVDMKEYWLATDEQTGTGLKPIVLLFHA